MDLNELTLIEWATIVYVILTVIGMIVAWFVIRWLIKKIVSLWSRSDNLFGSDQKIRLVSLGAAALVFPGVVTSLVSAIIYFVGNFFVDLPRNLIINWQNAINETACGANGYPLECLGQIGSGFTSGWSSAISGALGRFNASYMPYGQLILMLALWAVIAQILSTPAAENTNKAKPPRTWLQKSIEDMNDTTRQNIFFLLILTLGMYLSIAAIVAIPGLQETPTISAEVTAERLKQQMSASLTLMRSRTPETIELADPFTELNQYFLENPTADAYQKQDLEARKEARNKLLTQYTNLSQSTKAEAERQLESATASYQISLSSRKGSLETSKHFLLIDEWFRGLLTNQEQKIATCRAGIASANSYYQFWAANELQALQNPDSNLGLNDFRGVQESEFSNDVSKKCQSLSTIDAVPDRPDLGSNMGPFGFVASWLLRTESLPLAQIVGMLGFGLLGAVISNLVRTTAKKQKGGPLVSGLASIIIRGATAAVVVFLAVKGGLTVLTTGESDPNSYVLLLICFVAAVYSEDIWNEAHKRLQNTLDGTTENKEPQAPTGTEPAQNPNEPESTATNPVG